MAILIKGIDLPKGARYADISFLDKFGMPVGDEYIEEATQIDRPHGRLIDGDVIRSRIEFLKSGLTDHEKEAVGCILDKALRVIESYAEYAPTVLEAEE